MTTLRRAPADQDVKRKKPGNPLSGRELFIIGGRHSGFGEARCPIFKFIDMQVELVESIAAVRKCTGYFDDGMGRKEAAVYNRVLDGLLRGRSIDDLMTIDDTTYCYSIKQTLLALGRIRDAGIQITHLETESPSMMSYLLSFVYLIEPFGEMFAAARDRKIFANIMERGHERNILTIGSRHRLRDFQEKEHDFKVWRVDLVEDRDNGNIILSGSLPADFDSFIRPFAFRNGVMDLMGS